MIILVYLVIAFLLFWTLASLIRLIYLLGVGIFLRIASIGIGLWGVILDLLILGHKMWWAVRRRRF